MKITPQNVQHWDGWIMFDFLIIEEICQQNDEKCTASTRGLRS